MNAPVGTLPAPCVDTIGRHLELLFAPLRDEYPDGLVELRFGPVKPDRCAYFNMRDDGISEAAKFAASRNRERFNVYVGINPRKPGTNLRDCASDADVSEAVWQFADLDTAAASGAAGEVAKALPPTMFVVTGTVPHRRLHLYWKLDAPVENLQAWTERQRGLAQSFGGDAVINPSRIMRLAGTVNYPSDAKRDGRGYETELVQLRTDVDRAGPDVTPDQLRAVYPYKVNVSAPSSNGSDAASRTAQLLDACCAGDQWHNNMVRLVAHLAGKNRTSAEILAMADHITLPGYTVEQTRCEMLDALEGARRKWDVPEPEDQELGYVDADGVWSAYGSEWEEPGAQPEPALPGESGPAQWDGTRAPPRRFIIDGWIARGAAGMLGGQDGVGKSLLAQLMCTCAAAGLPFVGLQISRCRALYITCEDPSDEMQRRQESINESLGISMVDLKGWFKTYTLKGEIGNELGVFDASGRMSSTARYQQVRNAALEFGAELVILDNAAHFFAGNENARHDVASFLGLLERLSIEIDGAVILLAHPNKQHSQGNKQGNEYSGSTGWSAHVRNRLFLDWNGSENGMPADPDERVLRRSKANYAARGEEVFFRWHNWSFVRDEDLPPSIGKEIAQIARANAQNEAFLRCLDEATARRRTVSVSTNASNYAPKMFAQMTTGKAFKKNEFAAAMERLLHLGEIANDQPVYKRDNRTWALGLGRAQGSAQTVHKPSAQTRTEVGEEPQISAHSGARTCVPIDKSISGAAFGAGAPD